MTKLKQLAEKGINNTTLEEIEEAVQETLTEKMDRIIEIHEQWETVNLLIKLMNKELKIPDTAQPSDVRQAMDNLQKQYKEAMLQWREIQGHTRTK